MNKEKAIRPAKRKRGAWIKERAFQTIMHEFLQKCRKSFALKNSLVIRIAVCTYYAWFSCGMFYKLGHDASIASIFAYLLLNIYILKGTKYRYSVRYHKNLVHVNVTIKIIFILYHIPPWITTCWPYVSCTMLSIMCWPG